MKNCTLTNFEYYSEVNNEEDKFKIKELTKEIKNMWEIEGDHIWYKLKNPNLFIDYNGVQLNLVREIDKLIILDKNINTILIEILYLI